MLRNFLLCALFTITTNTVAQDKPPDPKKEYMWFIRNMSCSIAIYSEGFNYKSPEMILTASTYLTLAEKSYATFETLLDSLSRENARMLIDVVRRMPEVNIRQWQEIASAQTALAISRSVLTVFIQDSYALLCAGKEK